MDPISLAIMGGLGLTKRITGAVQSSRAKKDLAREFPKYSRPEEYNKLLSLYQREAGRGELPGQDRYEARISESTSRGVRSAAKYADSPVAAVAASSQLYGQQQSAIRDLGLQYAAFQQQATRNLAGAYQLGGQYSDKEWWQNVGYPDQVKRNMAAQRFNIGQQNLWGGLDQLGAAGINYFAGLQPSGEGATKPFSVATSPENTAAMQGFANNATLPFNFNPSSLVGGGYDPNLINP